MTEPPLPGLRRLLRGLHRRSLGLLPERLRDGHGEEIDDLFGELLAEAARRSPAAVAVLTARELAAIARLALSGRAAHVSHTPTDMEKDGMLSALLQDLRYAARSLRRSPGFAAIAVATLALGIGLNTAIFSVVNGVLLKPLDFPESDRLVAVNEASDAAPEELSATSPGSFADWQAQARRMKMAAYSTTRRVITGRGEPEMVTGVGYAGPLFEVLGSRPLLGRTLTPQDEDPTAPRAIVLSYSLWQTMFGGAAAAVGSSVTMNGESHIVVGVMPPRFRFPDASAAYWAPYRFSEEFKQNRDQYFLAAVGRLADGTSLDAATAEMQTIAARLRNEYPLYNTGLRVDVRPLRDFVVGDVGPRLYLLMGAVVTLLLITCANLANLLLARGGARLREVAVRQALGARRGRILTQLLAETVAIAFAGAALAVVLGHVFLGLLLETVPVDLPRAAEIELDPTVLGFTFATALGCGLLFGLYPAWQLARTSTHDVLRSGARSAAAGGVARRMLVISELALSIVLLAGSGLLLRSFAQLQRVDPGVTDPARVLTFTVSVRDSVPRFFTEVSERIAAVPGVRSVGFINALPVTGRSIGAWFNRLDEPTPPGETPPGEAYRVVSPEFFSTAGVQLLRGRLLTDRDGADGQPSVVVNEALVRAYWPDGDPIGREIYLGSPDNRLFPRATIVGIVSDTRDAGLGAAPLPIVYVPHGLMPYWRSFTYMVRSAGDPMALAAAARAALRDIDPTVPMREIRTMDDVIAESAAPTRWAMSMLTVFAALAVGLAALGVFGVLSYLVAQRTRELGIRLALGATPSVLRRMVLREGVALALVGITIGVALAVASARLLASLLYGVTGTDPVAFGGAIAALLAVVLVAAFVPAYRATRVDPLTALRTE